MHSHKLIRLKIEMLTTMLPRHLECSGRDVPRHVWLETGETAALTDRKLNDISNKSPALQVSMSSDRRELHGLIHSQVLQPPPG